MTPDQMTLQQVYAAWAGAAANLAVVVVTAAVAIWNIFETRAAQRQLRQQQCLVALISINQALEIIEKMFAAVEAADPQTPVNWGFLRMGFRAAVAAITPALGRDIPDPDLVNLAAHAMTLATTVSEDLERRAKDMPNMNGGNYLAANKELKESVTEQKAALDRANERLKLVAT